MTDPAFFQPPRAGATVYYWRGLDADTLERLELTEAPDGVTARASVLGAAPGDFRLDHRWTLNPSWEAQTVQVERRDRHGMRAVHLARSTHGWAVDGVPRPDLDGALEPDLSATPFCNTLAIRRLGPRAGAGLTLDVAFVDAQSLAVTRSRQRYVRLGPGRVRYTDLGVAAGFEAELRIDDDGLVLDYAHLFERIAQPARARDARSG